MARKGSKTWRIADELNGSTLRQLVNIGVSITFECTDCQHQATWPWPWMKNERRLKPLMDKRISDFAGKLRCIGCQSGSFYARRYEPSDQAREAR